MPPQSSKIFTKTDRALEDKMLAVAGDPERVAVLQKARAFKRTWIELGEALTSVHNRELWQRWEHESFEAYCRKELHLKAGTVAKLLGSFRFLESAAPMVIERARQEPSAPVPSMRAVDFVARASERGAADEDTMAEIKRVAFEEGGDAPLLSRRFKNVAFPIDEREQRDKLRSQAIAAARRLAGLIAEPDLPVPHQVAVRVEEALGELLSALEGTN